MIVVRQFCKRPVVIEAVEVTNENQADVAEWITTGGSAALDDPNGVAIHHARGHHARRHR